jgi:hypothetical protein
VLYITGEYIETHPAVPRVPTKTKLLSYLWPQTVTAESRGADFIQILYFEHTYRVRFGKVKHLKRRLDEAIDYDDSQKHRDQGCDFPPTGWWCSRQPGHEGPCAAREVRTDGRG